MNKRLVELIREEFEKALQAKTGWGRNDVLNVYDAAVARAVLRLLEDI